MALMQQFSVASHDFTPLLLTNVQLTSINNAQYCAMTIVCDCEFLRIIRDSRGLVSATQHRLGAILPDYVWSEKGNTQMLFGWQGQQIGRCVWELKRTSELHPCEAGVQDYPHGWQKHHAKSSVDGRLLDGVSAWLDLDGLGRKV